MAGVDDDRAQRRDLGNGQARRRARGGARRGRGLARGQGQGQEIDDEPRGRLLLVGLQLLEPAAQRDGEDVVLAPEELDDVDDPSREALRLREADVDHVARDGDRHAALLLGHAERYLLAGLDDDADGVAARRGAHVDAGHGDVPHQQRALEGAPLRLLAQERGQEARHRIDGNQPAARLQDDVRGEEAEIAVDGGQALVVVKRDLVAFRGERDGPHPWVRGGRDGHSLQQLGQGTSSASPRITGAISRRC